MRDARDADSPRCFCHSALSSLDAGVPDAASVSPCAVLRAEDSSSSSACSDAIAAASSVICAVTFGLPSRSPPIQVPRRAKGRTAGAVVPAASASSQSSSRRYTAGSTSARVASKTLTTVRTSSRTDGFASRSGAVRQSVSISPSRRRSFSASDMPPM